MSNFLDDDPYLGRLVRSQVAFSLKLSVEPARETGLDQDGKGRSCIGQAHTDVTSTRKLSAWSCRSSSSMVVSLIEAASGETMADDASESANLARTGRPSGLHPQNMTGIAATKYCYDPELPVRLSS